jgi:hypothetical protein
MKFLIKTSAVGISEKKFAVKGEYETADEKEIERLKAVSEKFPKDVEVLTGKKKAEEEDDENKGKKTDKKKK